MTRPPRRPHATGSPAAAGGQSPWPAWAPLALVLAASAWLHRGIFRFGFFADDFLFLDQARGKSLLATLASPDPIGNFLRPLGRQVHFWVFSRVGNESPVPFHVANLAFFLIALVLFERVARRVAGKVAALLATAILALHHVPDVPLLWASGSQDLIALVLALGALLLHVQGRRAWAAAAYGLALLAKETVLLTPLIAWLLAAREQGSLRASAKPMLPMAVAAALWAGLVIVTGPLRSTGATLLHADLLSVPAAIAHLVQSVFGLEWGSVGLADGWRWPSIVALAGAASGVLWVAGGARLTAAQGRAGAGRRAGARVRENAGTLAGLPVGLVWALCGALPVAAVAPIWSSYFYLYATFGAALVLGVLGARLPRPLMLLGLVLLSTLSARAGGREEFATAPGAWTTQSHVTRFYFERSAAIRDPMLEELRSARPTLPPHSTLFFSSVPANIGWQVADGPFVRWVYRDSSLHSQFLNKFSYALARGGPIFFFNLLGGHVEEMWKGDSSYAALAYSLIIDDHPECSRDAIRLATENGKVDRSEQLLMVWLEIEAGQADSARARLVRLGFGMEAGEAPELRSALKSVQAGGDTLRAIALLAGGLLRHPLDAGSHGLLADLLLARGGEMTAGEVEAFAARVLAPESPSGWRRWARVQIYGGRYRQAALSLERYFAMRGTADGEDPEARVWLNELRRRLPGGDIAQSSLRERARPSGTSQPSPGR
jgi:hypothetical protein